MSKRYRPWKIDAPMLLPATVQEFVDKDHLARFVLHLVVEEIDLEAFDADIGASRHIATSPVLQKHIYHVEMISI